MTYRILAICAALALSACTSDTVKDTLGLERSVPDEFRVVSRPPLSVPPQFTLRPPASSEASPNQLPADKRARSLISGGEAAKPTAKTGSGLSGADSEFLKQAGADNADPKVRDALTEEKYQHQERKDNRSWWDKIVDPEDSKDPMVDAKKEAERIKKNDDEGKPVTEGETPEVKAKDKGVLGRILGE